jgi:hypothetical protein
LLRDVTENRMSTSEHVYVRPCSGRGKKQIRSLRSERGWRDEAIYRRPQVGMNVRRDVTAQRSIGFFTRRPSLVFPETCTCTRQQVCPSRAQASNRAHGVVGAQYPFQSYISNQRSFGAIVFCHLLPTASCIILGTIWFQTSKTKRPTRTKLDLRFTTGSLYYTA